MSEVDRRTLNRYVTKLEEDLNKFEVVRNAGLDAVSAEHIHNFGREELKFGKDHTKEEVKEYLEELLKILEKKDVEDEEPNYVLSSGH